MTIKIATWPAWQRRTVALGVLAGALMLVWALVIGPLYFAVAWQRDWRTAAARTLAHDRALAAQKEELLAARSALQASAVWKGLLPAQPTATAVTTTQNDLRTLTDRLRIRIQAMQPLETRTEGRFARVGVRVTLELTIDQLEALLRALVAEDALWRLDHVLVTAPPYQSPEENPSLTVQFDAWRYQRTGTAT